MARFVFSFFFLFAYSVYIFHRFYLKHTVSVLKSNKYKTLQHQDKVSWARSCLCFSSDRHSQTRETVPQSHQGLASHEIQCLGHWHHSSGCQQRSRWGHAPVAFWNAILPRAFHGISQAALLGAILQPLAFLTGIRGSASLPGVLGPGACKTAINDKNSFLFSWGLYRALPLQIPTCFLAHSVAWLQNPYTCLCA